MRSFSPTGDTVNIDVSGTSQRLPLIPCEQVRVMNNGSATAWARFGDSTITVSASNGMPIAPGATEVLDIPIRLKGAAVNVAAIAAGSTGRIYFTPGRGI